MINNYFNSNYFIIFSFIITLLSFFYYFISFDFSIYFLCFCVLFACYIINNALYEYSKQLNNKSLHIINDNNLYISNDHFNNNINEIYKEIQYIKDNQNIIYNNILDKLSKEINNIKQEYNKEKLQILQKQNKMKHENDNITNIDNIDNKNKDNNNYSNIINNQIDETTNLLKESSILSKNIDINKSIEAYNQISKEIELLSNGLISDKNILDDFDSEFDISSSEDEDNIDKDNNNYSSIINNDIDISKESLQIDSITELLNESNNITNTNQIDNTSINNTNITLLSDNTSNSPKQNRPRSRSSTEPGSISKKPIRWTMYSPKKSENIQPFLIHRNVDNTTPRSNLLRAAHRSTLNIHELELDQLTYRKLQEKIQVGSPIRNTLAIDNSTKQKKEALTAIGLNSSRAIVKPKSKLLFSVDISLPYGGTTHIQCFQDAPQSEIMKMLWIKLDVGNHGPDLSAESFVAISQLLLNDDFCIMQALFFSCGLSNKDHVTQLFIELIISQKQSVDYIKLAIRDEVKSHIGSINSLFRGNSWKTVLVAKFFRYHLQNYFMDLLLPILRSSLTHPIFENKDNITDDLTKEAREKAIIELTLKLFKAIVKSTELFPPVVKGLFHYLSKIVDKRYPGQEMKVLAGFLFLRLICPLLISSPIDLKPEWKTPLLKVTRYLQLIANLVPVNNCVDNTKIQMAQKQAVEMFNYFSSIKHPLEEYSIPALDEISGISTRDIVSKLYQLVIDNLKNIIIYTKTEFGEEYIKRLIDITGYPLGEPKDYQLKVKNTDFYFPSGSYRPLVDNLSLQEYFTKYPFVSPAFSLVGKDDFRHEKRLTLQLGCLIGDNDLPSWRFDDDEINHFRENVIVPLTNINIPNYILLAQIQENFDLPRTFLIRIHITKGMAKSLYISPQCLIIDLIDQTMKKAKSFLPDNACIEDYIFKLAELDQYIINYDLRIGCVSYISKCLSRNTPVELSLVEKKDFLLPPKDNNYPFTNPPISYNILNDPIISTSKLWNNVTTIPSCNKIFSSLYDETEPHQRISIYIDRIIDLDKNNIRLNDQYYCFIQVELYHNGKLLTPCVRTEPSKITSLLWGEQIELDIAYRNIPLESRICFTLYSMQIKNDSKIPIAWVGCRLYDNFHCIKREKDPFLRMWINDGKANPIGSCNSNPSTHAPKLCVEFPKFDSKYVQLPRPLPRSQSLILPADILEPTEEQKQILHKIIHSNPLYNPTKDELHLLWNCREYLKDKPRALYKFLLSVQWKNFFLVEEVYRLLEEWAKPINILDILELLGTSYEDERIRQYAINHLSNINNSELSNYLLQLVQVLKHEKDHYNALFLFLLGRSIISPYIIGNKLFWLLFAEIEYPITNIRFSLYLETLIRALKSQRETFMQQHEFIQIMNIISSEVSEEKTRQTKNEILYKLLNVRRLPSSFKIPYEPSLQVGKLIIDKCKVMDSHQAPLFLAFNNNSLSKQHVYILYKSGDDLRQDVLTLQMIQIMDNIWQNENIDLRMTPYRCMNTGTQQGIIEIVKHSVTTADIHKKIAGIRGAFLEHSVANWLRAQNPDENNYSKAKETFIRSCAGYCVATFILGIGDRHNDNIMISKTGHLFRNWQKWKGFKRDRAPFVFTPEFAYIMGGKNSEGFERFCTFACDAFIIIRKYSHIFINMFKLMISTGMPELKSSNNLLYLLEAFAVDKNETEARQYFRALILKSLNTTATRVNNAIHIFAHPT